MRSLGNAGCESVFAHESKSEVEQRCKGMKKNREIEVNGTSVRVVTVASEDYSCLTDMLKSKDGEFFFSDWLRNCHGKRG